MKNLLPLFKKPSHYAGMEIGSVHKNKKDITLHIALAFPDSYEVGMSYLGQKILYHIVNNHDNWFAERIMAPEPENGKILQNHNTALSSLESDTALSEFDCICFSVTHELCYTNILYMLDLAKIPLRSKNRGNNISDYPLIIAGGGAIFSAEPLTPFIDIMVLGDGEEVFPELLSLVEDAKYKKLDKERLKYEASKIEGIYIPDYFDDSGNPIKDNIKQPKRRIVHDLTKTTYPTSQVVPIGAVHNRLSLEIARGCTRNCRFCQAGIVYRPVRERSISNINDLLEKCLTKTGFEEISFLSLSTGDFSALKTLCNHTLDKCIQEQISLSLPSQRVGSIDDDIISKIADLRRTGCTIAPEAGSQRLRNVINKGITEENILLHALKFLEHGWRNIKLYFMIGLPTETDDDLLAIVELCKKIRNVAGKNGPRLQITASLSPFVPKAWTPFQWEAQINENEIKRRITFILNEFKKNKGLTLRWHEPAMSHLEGILSRADRKMADVIEKAYKKGAIFCNWMEYFDLNLWNEALNECNINDNDYIKGFDLDAKLPWSHLDIGLNKNFLLNERNNAYLGKVVEDCRYNSCLNCGICNKDIKNILNFKARDQKGNNAHFDDDGNLICKSTVNKPPQISPNLCKNAIQYRVWHVKQNNSSFLSQLELQAILERAFRRGKVPISFTQGFHPLPKFSFGRALPVGVESKIEWFSITLREIINKNLLISTLNKYLPTDLQIFNAEIVDKTSRSEQSISESFICSLNGENIDKYFEDFCMKKSFIIIKESKKGKKEIDLRPLLTSFKKLGNNSIEITTNWQNQYFSPLSLCLYILSQNLNDNNLHSKIHLCKIAQIFSNNHYYGIQGA